MGDTNAQRYSAEMQHDTQALCIWYQIKIHLLGFESLHAELNWVTLSVLILDATTGGLRLRISVLNDNNSATGT